MYGYAWLLTGYWKTGCNQLDVFLAIVLTDVNRLTLVWSGYLNVQKSYNWLWLWLLEFVVINLTEPNLQTLQVVSLRLQRTSSSSCFPSHQCPKISSTNHSESSGAPKS